MVFVLLSRDEAADTHSSIYVAFKRDFFRKPAIDQASTMLKALADMYTAFRPSCGRVSRVVHGTPTPVPLKR